MSAGIILRENVSYWFQILPGTYATGTIVGWDDDPALGRTYHVKDYAWVSKMLRMSTFAERVASGNLHGCLIEYLGDGPPHLIPAGLISQAHPIAHAITKTVP